MHWRPADFEQATLWEIYDANEGYYKDVCRRLGIDPDKNKALTEEEIEEIQELLEQDEKREAAKRGNR